MVVEVNILARDGQCGQHLLELTASPWVKERTSIPLILVGGLWYSPHLATAHHAVKTNWNVIIVPNPAS